jgi:hypothetical protein
MTDRFRPHLLEGHEAEAARMPDEHLAQADSRPRIEQLDDKRGGSGRVGPGFESRRAQYNPNAHAGLA